MRWKQNKMTMLNNSAMRELGLLSKGFGERKLESWTNMNI